MINKRVKCERDKERMRRRGEEGGLRKGEGLSSK